MSCFQIPIKPSCVVPLTDFLANGSTALFLPPIIFWNDLIALEQYLALGFLAPFFIIWYIYGELVKLYILKADQNVALMTKKMYWE